MYFITTAIYLRNSRDKKTQWKTMQNWYKGINWQKSITILISILHCLDCLLCTSRCIGYSWKRIELPSFQKRTIVSKIASHRLGNFSIDSGSIVCKNMKKCYHPHLCQQSLYYKEKNIFLNRFGSWTDKKELQKMTH